VLIYVNSMLCSYGVINCVCEVWGGGGWLVIMLVVAVCSYDSRYVSLQTELGCVQQQVAARYCD